MQKNQPIILAIDTSCDDTSVAVTQGLRVLSNVIASQEEMHRKYGGVMPLVAKLAHHEFINPTYQEALKRAKITDKEIDAIAVTQGPGLAIALEVGIEFAKSLAKELNKPLIGVNHMLGHLYSSLAVNAKGNGELPQWKENATILGLLVSGGHSEIVLMKYNQGKFENKIIGETLDDAAGECLDKLARMLDLGYPGARTMEQLAKEGDEKSYPFPLPMTQSHDLNYSFSGLKTFGNQLVKNLPKPLEKKDICNLSASFQYGVIRALMYKLKKAIEQYQPEELWLGGGVVNNIALRTAVRTLITDKNCTLRIPYTKKLMSDNGAMIGVAAYWQYLQQDFIQDFDAFQRIPRLDLEK